MSSGSGDNSTPCGYNPTFPQVLCELRDPVEDGSIGAQDPLHLLNRVQDCGVVALELLTDFG